MLDTYFEARFKLSVELRGLNDESVHQITEGLRDIIEIRDKTQNVIDEVLSHGNEACVNETIDAWQNHLRDVGVAVQGCVDIHVDPISLLTEELHLYMQDHNKLAFDVQNMVLNIFTEASNIIRPNQYIHIQVILVEPND